ncbi:Holliday junction branch migration protein RuvA [Pseudogemmatithrix spongiicola]|uniref:Holliday junction branch migration complex subunit RuvA n=1 Tax=Pseudogemmatithrix spongiicola TaxID=3062599 RepID=A0AA49Q7H9_9BACT|nr:Holliday junction branch migration protein RuvA [Gemmatimonadaceae bacterium 'strain 138']WKW14100.1 Holliday junction branch migration protein RuvA [Gemmatimonadaceae bacterium 'strain 318']
MIARLDGTLAAHGLDRIELRTSGGVTYEVMVPLSVLEALPKLGGELALHTAMVVREDATTLYGFATSDERKLFQRLMSTTGVGPSLAMNLLSTLTGERLVRAIREGDLTALTRVPRVGKKLAERLVLELRDKLEGAEVSVSGAKPVGSGGPSADAARALVALGYQPADAERAVRAALDGAPKGETTADLIRRALAGLAK